MTTLRQGDRGAAVLELQWLLRATGHDPGKLDGVFGPMTREAVQLWFEDHGPPWTAADAEMDDDDLSVLRSAPRRAIELPRMLTPIAAVDMRIALVAGYASAVPHHEEHRWQNTEDYTGNNVCAACGANDGDEAALKTCPRLSNAVRVALAQLCVEHGCEPWGGPQTTSLVDHGLLPLYWLRPNAAEMSYIAVWSNNVGNRQVRREDRVYSLTAPRLPTVPWFALPAPEGTGAASHVVTSACYAYPNAAEGAAAYWRFLRDHCGPALAAFDAGDPAAAAHELKAAEVQIQTQDGRRPTHIICVDCRPGAKGRIVKVAPGGRVPSRCVTCRRRHKDKMRKEKNPEAWAARANIRNRRRRQRPEVLEKNRRVCARRYAEIREERKAKFRANYAKRRAAKKATES